MKKLSVVVSAYNEEKTIRSCLQSVSWADEIVVIDNSSTDKTAAVAKSFGAVVYSRPNYPMLNTNKNYGFKKAKGDWILNLDADETVSEELKKEVISILKKGVDNSEGYEIPRKNYIFGKWIQHAGWYPDYQIRLFKNGSGVFNEKHVHEKIHIRGVVQPLQGHIIHQNYRSVSHFLSKLDLYTENEADNLLANGYQFSRVDAIRLPKNEFISRYFAREGYKDGLHGLSLSILMAFYHFLVFLKVWEKNKFESTPMPVSVVQEEFSTADKESRHWFSQSGGKKIGFIKRLFKRFI
jgi:glycosyltransferase involved in cell wall biosynthesis